MHRVHNADISTEEKRQLWSALIEEYTQLNITQRQFCLERDIKHDVFCYYYLRHKKKITSLTSPVHFIPMDKIQNRTAPKLHIIYQQFEIQVPETFEDNHFLRVLQLIRQVSC